MPADPLTPKQRQIVNFMRGNRSVLDRYGRRSLRRDGWSNRGIDVVIRNLAEKGLVVWEGPSDFYFPRLTEEGRRA